MRKRRVGPPTLQSPPSEPLVSQPPSTNAGAGRAPEIVIDLGGVSGVNPANGSTSPELVISVGQGRVSSSSSPEEVQINLASDRGATTVSIDATQGKTGSSEQVTINLQPQQNYELILNLFSSSSGNRTQARLSKALSVSA